MTQKHNIDLIATQHGLRAYISAEAHVSSLFNVPMAKLAETKVMLAAALKDTTLCPRYRYRGPRNKDAQSTLRTDATHFSVYLNERVQKYKSSVVPYKQPVKVPQFVWVDGYQYQRCG